MGRGERQPLRQRTLLVIIAVMLGLTTMLGSVILLMSTRVHGDPVLWVTVVLGAGVAMVTLALRIMHALGWL